MEKARFTVKFPVTSHGARMRLLEMFCAALAILLAVVPLSGRELCHDNAWAEAADRSRLLLYAKHPATWKIVAGGARAEILFERSSGCYAIRAVGLVANTRYVLARVDSASRSGELLGMATTDRQGNLHFSGRWHHWCGRFWLVTDADIRALPLPAPVGARLQLKAWHPAAYLFESEVLR